MSDLFGKQLRKKTARAKEKLLEGIGKAKATQDVAFDQHAANLSKQSKACDRLYRDLKNYGVALKTMVQAQKTLRETIRDLYEPEWPDREHLCAITQSLDAQWDEFEKTVNEQLMGSVNDYMAQFTELKAKIAKRGRKLVDFDSARNYFEGVKASCKKSSDDPKLLKAAADLQKAEELYKELNKELVDTLPATYDSRITFFVDTLQTIFNVESTNHNECGKYNKSLVTLLDALGNAFDSLRVPRAIIDDTSSVQTNEESASRPEMPLPRPRSELPVPAPRQISPARNSTVSLPLKDEKEANGRLYPALNAAPPMITEESTKKPAEKLLESEKAEKGSKGSLNPFEEDDEEDLANPFEHVQMPQETKEKGPLSETQKAEEKSREDDSDERKILRKVRATHHYSAEDTDELTFDAGEIIAVLESREEDFLDDGWLLGVKQSDGTRGVFPANFTKSL